MRAPGIIRVLRLCAVSLCLTAAAPALLGTAFAQSADGRGVEAFIRAAKAYEAGDWNTAAGAVDDAMQAGLSKELSARAYHLRAHIDEHSGALARALQDYSTALFMDTLPQSERKVALEGKQRVIAAMGLNSFTPGTPGASHADAAPPAAPQSSSGGGVWDMFGGVFGSSQPAAPPPPAPPPVQAAEPAPAPAPAPEASTTATRVVTRAKPGNATPAKPASPPKAAQAQKPRAQPPVRIAAIQPVATAPASSANGFLILFGSTGSEAASRTRARQIKAALADILVSRELDVLASADGSYQIAAGPYKAKSAALALCSAMKQRGVACQVTP